MTDAHAKAREIADKLLEDMITDGARYISTEKYKERIAAALEAERKVVYEEIAANQALVHGESVMLNGKLVTNEELYKQPTDYVKEAGTEGYRRGLEEAAEICKFIGDCLPDTAKAAKKQAHSCEASIRQRAKEGQR